MGRSASRFDDHGRVCAGRDEGVAVCGRAGYLFAGSEEPVDVPAQSGVLHCVCGLVRRRESCFLTSGLWLIYNYLRSRQGPDRAQPTIRPGAAVPPAAVRADRGGRAAHSVLAVAAAVPQVVGEVREHAGGAERGVVHTARDGDQLLVLVPGRDRVPVRDTPEAVCVVEQV
jgi:hypothetical protein